MRRGINKERIANRRRRITNGYIARRSCGEIHTAELKNSRLKLDEIRLELSRAEIQREQLASHLKHAETALLDAKIALQTDQTAIKQRDLSEKLSALDAELTILRQRQTETEDALGKEFVDAKKLVDFLGTDKQQIPLELETFAAKKKSGKRNAPHTTLSKVINHHLKLYPRVIPANKSS